MRGQWWGVGKCGVERRAAAAVAAVSGGAISKGGQAAVGGESLVGQFSVLKVQNRNTQNRVYLDVVVALRVLDESDSLRSVIAPAWGQR